MQQDWPDWVVDATMGCHKGLFTFCPVESLVGDGVSIVIGMNFLGNRPPEGANLVGIFHANGQDALEQFCQDYAIELAALEER